MPICQISTGTSQANNFKALKNEKGIAVLNLCFVDNHFNMYTD